MVSIDLDYWYKQSTKSDLWKIILSWGCGRKRSDSFILTFTKQTTKVHYTDRLDKILHVMEFMNIPFPVEDFDVLKICEHWSSSCW